MPIEIKELHIRVSVNAPAGGKPAGAPGPAPGAEGDARAGARRRVRRAGAAGPARPEGALSADGGRRQAREDADPRLRHGRGRRERRHCARRRTRFEALINPETYTLEYKVKTADGQGQGTSGAQTKFEYTLPEELTFDFLFDNTGLIDGKPEARRRLRRRRRVPQAPHRVPGRARTSRTTSSWSGGTSSSRAGRSRSASPTSCSTPTASRSARWCGSSSRARSRRRSGPRWRTASRPTSPTGAS